jgi:hypothetical protein
LVDCRTTTSVRLAALYVAGAANTARTVIELPEAGMNDLVRFGTGHAADLLHGAMAAPTGP